MTEQDDNNNNMRLIFRPTKEQYDQLQIILSTGRYAHLSELLRDAVTRGASDIIKQIKKEQGVKL